MSRRIPIGILRQIIMRINAGLSNRSIANDLHIVSRKTISKYRQQILSLDISGTDLEKLQDTELGDLFERKKRRKGAYSTSEKKQDLLSLVDYIQSELNRPGVTLQLLWQEYCEQNAQKGACSYQSFCRILKPHLSKTNLSFRNPGFSPGEVLMIDFAGNKLWYTDKHTMTKVPCFVFVAILSYSKYSFAEVVPKSTTEFVLEAMTNALKYIGGIPSSVLTDNMAQLVKKADRYEPDFTDAALSWANHYGVILRATRAYSPKDKPDIERQVRLTYERIYAPLRDHTFYSLNELRAAVRQKLEEHNGRKFHGKSYSRRDCFLADEQSQLKKLSASHFELQKITKAKVQKNYHVLLGEDRHYYSVPYQLVGESIDIRYTAHMVEIYFKSDLITLHRRTAQAYNYTTKIEHMPEAHKAYSQAMGYKGEDFVRKAASIGPQTRLYIEQVLKSRAHEQQAYRSCMGVLSLGFSKKYGRERLEKACTLGCQLEKYSYKTIQGILEKKLDLRFASGQESENEINTGGSLSNHENLRGKEAFG